MFRGVSRIGSWWTNKRWQPQDWGKVCWKDNLIQARNGYRMLWVKNRMPFQDPKIDHIQHHTFPSLFFSFPCLIFLCSFFVLFHPFHFFFLLFIHVSSFFLPLLIYQGRNWTIAWIICWTNSLSLLVHLLMRPSFLAPAPWTGGTTRSQSSRGVGECCDEARDGGATTVP